MPSSPPEIGPAPAIAFGNQKASEPASRSKLPDASAALFLKGIISTSASQILIAAYGVVLIPLLIRTAGLAVYGQYVLISALLGFVYAVSACGVGFTRARYLPAAQRCERPQLFYPALFYQGAVLASIAILFALLHETVAAWFRYDPSQFSPWIVLPYFVGYLSYAHTTDYFRFTNRLTTANTMTVLFPYVTLALILCARFAMAGLNVNALILSQAAAALLVAIPFAIRLLREAPLSRHATSWSGLKHDIALGIPLTFGYITDVLMQSADRVALGAFGSAELVGRYVPAATLGAVVLVAMRIAGYVLPAVLARTVDRGGRDDAWRLFERTIEGYLIVGMGLVAGSVVLSRSVLRLYAGPVVADSSWAVTPLIACGALLYGQAMLMIEPLKVHLETRKILRVQLLSASVNVALNIGLLWLYPTPIAAAIASALASLVGFTAMRMALNSVWRASETHVRASRILIAAVVMAVTVAAAKPMVGGEPASFGATLVLIGLGAAVYAGCLVGGGVIRFRDLTRLHQLIRTPVTSAGAA